MKKKLKFRAEVFSDLVISSSNQNITTIRGWDYKMLDPVICPIYVLLFDCWIFSRALQIVKPTYWKEILDRVHLNVWEKNSKIIKKEDFFQMAQKLYRQLDLALNFELSEKCSIKLQIGEIICTLCFGKEHVGADAVLYFEQISCEGVKLLTKTIKGLSDDQFFTEQPILSKDMKMGTPANSGVNSGN